MLGTAQVSRRAKIRGLPQLGTLGAGNHYAEIQVVDEVFNEQAAKKMGIDRVGQVEWIVHNGVYICNIYIRACLWLADDKPI